MRATPRCRSSAPSRWRQVSSGARETHRTRPSRNCQAVRQSVQEARAAAAVNRPCWRRQGIETSLSTGRHRVLPVVSAGKALQGALLGVTFNLEVRSVAAVAHRDGPLPMTRSSRRTRETTSESG
jgi:hypothetical protein